MRQTRHFDFTNFRAADPDLTPPDPDFIEYLVRHELPDRRLHFERLWAYYANDLTPLGQGLSPAEAKAWCKTARPYVQAQEFGLPARITGRSHLGYGGAGVPEPETSRKEVVIENDIGWRVDTGVHFLAGRAPAIESLASDPSAARRIEAALEAVYAASGGPALWQEMALLGAVYGFVDLVVRAASEKLSAKASSDPAGAVAIEVIDAPRILPVLDENDYRRLACWVQVYDKQVPELESTHRLFGGGRGKPRTVEVVELLAPWWWQRYEDGELTGEGPNPLGRVPVVHVQNMPSPTHYEGTSEVEPLIPLQDELNTRLSDRASRVTLQSFKMYLGRGIDGFEDRPVSPGQMWATDNPDATIECFGGDAESPSEAAHVEDLRQAMDKVSGVTPLAAGLLRDKIGNLTSATALRVVLSGTLARLDRKRVTYEAGIVEANRLVLEALDRLAVLRTTPDQRATRLHWPNPLPEDVQGKLAEARAKRDLGVPAETVLSELGYGTGQ